MAKRRDLDSFVEEAINNIKEDRSVTNYLLTDLLAFINETNRNHKEVGLIAAKYLETLQRSNEQLVKLTALIQKQQSSHDVALSESDKEEIFDIINAKDKED
jgi:Asp-tRNA(Asn)/Glu-tRNA(Gln) amidotransferase B subunit